MLVNPNAERLVRVVLLAGVCVTLVFKAAAAPGRVTPTVELDAAAGEVVAGTNAFRQSQQLVPLSVNTSLQAAARDFAEYMARNERYGHQADGRSPAERVRNHGYNYCLIAENIGQVHRVPEYTGEEIARALVDGWIASPRHRRAMLDVDATEIAVAIVRSAGSGHYYGVQLIGRSRGEAIRMQVANQGLLEVRYEIDERMYHLAPRSVHTHTLCRNSTLVMTLPEGTIVRTSPVDGQRYTAKPAMDGHWTLLAD